MAREVFEGLGADKFLVRVTVGWLKFSLNSRLQRPVVRTGGLPFAQASQGGDDAQIKFGFLDQEIGEGSGIERSEKLVELSGGNCAPGILNGGSSFLLEQASGAFPGRLKSLGALEVCQPTWIGVSVPACNVIHVEMFDRLADGLEKTGGCISAIGGDPRVSTARQRPGMGWREPYGVDFRICAFRRY